MFFLSLTGGGLLGAAAGIKITRKLSTWPLRLVARCIIAPPLASLCSTAVTGAISTAAVYSAREDAQDILVPLGPKVDAFVREQLPESLIEVTEYRKV